MASHCRKDLQLRHVAQQPSDFGGYVDTCGASPFRNRVDGVVASVRRCLAKVSALTISHASSVWSNSMKRYPIVKNLGIGLIFGSRKL